MRVGQVAFIGEMSDMYKVYVIYFEKEPTWET